MCGTDLEQVLRVEQARVNFGWRLEAQADHKDLSRGVPRSCGLGGLHLVKQLLEGIQQSIVILRPAYQARANLWSCQCFLHLES